MAEQTLDNTSINIAEQNDRDLGFGSVVTGQSRQRLLNADGTFNVQRTGLPLLTSLNLFHSLLTMSWRTFLLLVLLLYFMSNIVFGAVYASLGPDAIIDTTTNPRTKIFAIGLVVVSIIASGPSNA